MTILEIALTRAKLPISVSVDTERYTCPYWTVKSPSGTAVTFSPVHAMRAYLAAVRELLRNGAA